MGYVIGIDQGGTKTSLVLCDLEGHVLCREEAFGSCYSVYGMDHAMAAISTAFGRMKDKMNIKTCDITYVVCGLSGADFDFEFVLLRENVSQTLKIDQKKIAVTNDSIIALRGGTEDEYGAVICGGTGMNCAFIDKSGKQMILGYYIDDAHQGASAIGRKGIIAVFDQESGVGKKTELTEKVLEYYQIESVDGLLQRFVFDKEIKSRMKNLVPLIFECANAQDEVALGIVSEFGEKWAAYIVAGLKKLSMDYPMKLVFSGGVFKEGSGRLIDYIIKDVASRCPWVSFVEAEYEPVLGAVQMALDHFGECSREIRNRNIYNSACMYDLIRKRRKR